MAAAKDNATQSVPTSVTPADAEPFAIPAAPDLPKCPVCKYGLLYVVAVDEDATHENQAATREGNPTSHAHFAASGGAMTLKCLNCMTPQTQPMNPDADELAEALAASRSAQDQENRTSGAR